MHRMDSSSGAVVGVNRTDFATAMKVSDQNNNGQSERHEGRVKSLNADRLRVRAML